MKNSIILLALFFYSLNMFAQASGNYNYGNPNNARQNVLQNPTPDAHLVIFNIIQVGITATEANNLVKARYDAFLEAAISAGIQKKDIYSYFIPKHPVSSTKNNSFQY